MSSHDTNDFTLNSLHASRKASTFFLHLILGSGVFLSGSAMCVQTAGWKEWASWQRMTPSASREEREAIGRESRLVPHRWSMVFFILSTTTVSEGAAEGTAFPFNPLARRTTDVVIEELFIPVTVLLLIVVVTELEREEAEELGVLLLLLPLPGLAAAAAVVEDGVGRVTVEEGVGLLVLTMDVVMEGLAALEGATLTGPEGRVDGDSDEEDEEPEEGGGGPPGRRAIEGDLATLVMEPLPAGVTARFPFTPFAAEERRGVAFFSPPFTSPLFSTTERVIVEDCIGATFETGLCLVMEGDAEEGEEWARGGGGGATEGGVEEETAVGGEGAGPAGLGATIVLGWDTAVVDAGTLDTGWEGARTESFLFMLALSTFSFFSISIFMPIDSSFSFSPSLFSTTLAIFLSYTLSSPVKSAETSDAEEEEEEGTQLEYDEAEAEVDESLEYELGDALEAGAEAKPSSVFSFFSSAATVLSVTVVPLVRPAPLLRSLHPLEISNELELNDLRVAVPPLAENRHPSSRLDCTESHLKMCSRPFSTTVRGGETSGLGTTTSLLMHLMVDSWRGSEGSRLDEMSRVCRVSVHNSLGNVSNLLWLTFSIRSAERRERSVGRMRNLL